MMQQPKKNIELFFFFLFLSCIFSYTTSSTVASRPSIDEASILLSMKSELFDPLNHLKDWELPKYGLQIGSGSHCSWTGVYCNSLGSVEELDLSHMNISGKISDQIQQLKSLTSLNLCCNGFSSRVPKFIANLTSLKSLDVSQNLFFGSFPSEFGKLTVLTNLNASENNFVGDLPGSLGNATMLESLDLRGSFFKGSIPLSYMLGLKRLRFLGLSGNNLTGSIPTLLGRLSSLETLILGYNGFEGEVPREIGNLTNLRYLDLAIANLSGEIPAELSSLAKVNTMYLYSNNLQGEIPPTIGNMTSLTFFDLSNNLLSGAIPAQIGELKRLQLLNLMCNKLTGTVPVLISQLSQLQVLELWNNSLSGPLPKDLGKNAPLQWLDISSNSFSGQIPDNLCNGGNLTKLILFNNAFTGPIPISLTKCQSLVRVRLQNNQLYGTIPVGLGKLSRLQRLELANNSLVGRIPDDLSSSQSISFIDLSRNHLQFSLPATLFSISYLQTFMASNNKLEGEIPDQFQDCPSLSVLDLSSNHFTGSIPSSIASCEKLVTLGLKNNQLTGKIPESIASMPMLAILDLSNNSISGQIPEHFGSSPALEMLNISYNNLSGCVPSNGLLRTINPEDLAGNPALCGGIIPPCPMNSLGAAGSVTSRLHSRRVLTQWAIGISTVLAIAIAALGAHLAYKKCYANGRCFEERFDPGNGKWPWRLMAFQRLGFTSNDILSCIKESNVIGMGATGVVYKAELPSSNTVVAVKKLWKPTHDVEAGSGDDDLAGEVNLLGKLRHRNIVRLLGFLHNDKDAMIIYEYMQNGNLGDALHRNKGEGLLVDWVSRYNIAVGVAQGLAYLHHDCHPPVIHRDVKSSNILLDSDLEARIADFGLAKMMIRKNETVSMVAGSYGYIAPEYGYTMKVDEKSDVYSFGVVLLELLTGHKPLDPQFGESADVVGWIRSKVRTNRPLEEVLDPNLCGNSKHAQEEMMLIVRIALLCTANLPKDRPSMRDVITILSEAKPRRKSNGDKDKPVFSPSLVNGLL